jgi:arsenite methyltransferase
MPETDKWLRWLAETRFGGDQKATARGLKALTRVRDRLLKRSGLTDGKVLLDVGTGEGLVGFGALAKVEPGGRVIFSDISDSCLEFTRSAAERLGVVDRCSFVRASADDLTQIEDESVDVVATRSVLIYVADKSRAFKEFLRVLKPGGRTALFEPIADNRMKEDAAFWNLARRPGTPDEIAPIKDLLDKVGAWWKSHRQVNEAMTNFNERDLVRMCVEAGFAAVHTELYLDVGPMAPRSWEFFLNSSPNPLIPSFAEVQKEIFNDEERERYERHLSPLIERGGQPFRSQGSYTWAFKAPVPKQPWPEEE